MRDTKGEIESLLAEGRALRLIRCSEMDKFRAISESIRSLARTPYTCVIEPVPGILVQVTGAILSPREKQVLRLMLEGDSRKEIASILEIAEGTVAQYARC